MDWVPTRPVGDMVVAAVTPSIFSTPRCSVVNSRKKHRLRRISALMKKAKQSTKTFSRMGRSGIDGWTFTCSRSGPMIGTGVTMSQ